MGTLDRSAGRKPPRQGQEIPILVNATATSYNLQALAMASYTPDAANTRSNRVWLTMTCNADIFYHLTSNSTAALNTSAFIAVGGTLAYSNSYGTPLWQKTVSEFELERAKDKYLHLATASGEAMVYLFVSSEDE